MCCSSWNSWKALQVATSFQARLPLPLVPAASTAGCQPCLHGLGSRLLALAAPYPRLLAQHRARELRAPATSDLACEFEARPVTSLLGTQMAIRRDVWLPIDGPSEPCMSVLKAPRWTRP